MAGVQKRKIRRAISLLLVMLYFTCLPAQAQYGGGSGEPNNPYLIYTAEQMNAIGANANDWDKHFKLMADVDLAGYTGTDFNIIGYYLSYYDKKPFTGVFDGSSHTISNFTYTSTDTHWIGLFSYVDDPNSEIRDLGLIDPNVDAGTGTRVGSLVGYLRSGTITNCYADGGSVSGDWDVGGLVGYNSVSTITNCYATASVSGGWYVGGLVGSNGDWESTGAVLTNCYSTGTVSGDMCIGGLVGWNYDTISNCYSSGGVTGTTNVGGLLGYNEYGTVTDSFWDIETSGQTTSAGGIGKATAEMQMESTFTDAGWDFVGESVNGTEDIWWILEGRGYPRLYWEPIEDGQTRANVYYVDAVNGDNSNDGLSLQTAFATIQQGIDSAAHGDTVIVAPATYTGPGNRDLDFRGKAITVRSIDPNGQNVVAATIIDCQGSVGDEHRGFYFHSGETSSAVLDGFTIKNGYKHPGAGIYCSGSNPVIKNCKITKNKAEWLNGVGGGCYFSNSSAKIINCRITFNSAIGTSTHSGNGWGGGIACGGSTLEVKNTEISNNYGTSASGGIGAGWNSNLYIDNCVISHNSSQFGSGFKFQDSNINIINSTITENSAIFSGGAIYGIRSNIIVTNTILWGDTGGEIDGWDSSITVTYSDVQGGWAGEGNINADPLFVNVANADYHLQASSPCIDAGDNTAIPPSVVVDLDGNPRIINGIVDMGAYEGGVAPPSDVYYVDAVSGDNSNDGLSLETAFASIQKGIDMAGDGDVVLVYPGLYQEEINFLSKALTVQGVVASPAGVPVLQNPGDFAVSFYYGEGPDSILKNFIIRDSFMGIFIAGSAPTISNLTVVDNKYGIEAYAGSEPNISNTIFWNNSDDDLFQCQARYSCIERGGEGEGNITFDPLFVDPDNGDYHLYSERGRYWPEHDVWILDKVTSPCIDGGDPNVAPLDEPRPNGGRINIGAYGGTPEASLSPSGQPHSLLGRASNPSPSDGAVGVNRNVTLSWTPGFDAALHNVYFGVNFDNVNQSNVDDDTWGVLVSQGQAGNVYDPAGTLELGKTYYWRIDEYNTDETISKGNVWSFTTITTANFLVVDDFEDYNDYPPNEIWATWIDPYVISLNGGTVGYPNPNWDLGEHYVETTIVHGGEQSMPFFYSNTGGAAYSEGYRTFAVPQDWTAPGVQTLALWFHGTAGNTGQLYVKVNGSKVLYDGNATNLALMSWQLWNIDLASFGVNLRNVTSLAIGIDGFRASGILYFDDIRLYPPAEP